MPRQPLTNPALPVSHCEDRKPLSNSQHQWVLAQAALNVKTSQWLVSLHSASHCPTVAGVVLSLELSWHLV